MQTEYIRNFNGSILGILETQANGDQIVREFPSQRILGFYRKKEDHTTDFYGRILSRGNTVISLLYKK